MLRRRLATLICALVATLTLPRLAAADWQKMSPYTSPDGGCAGMKFFSDVNGLVFCNNKVFTTSDGMTWGNPVDVPQLMASLLPGGMTFLSKQTWLASGNSFDASMNLVGKTTDGGKNWMAKPAAGSTGMADTKLSFLDAQNGLAYGLGAANKALLAATADGGDTWKEVALPFIDPVGTVSRVVSVGMVDASTWVINAVQTGGAKSATFVQRTTDGGANWAAAMAPNTGFLFIQFVDPTHGFGWAPIGPTAGLYTSTDGGAMWTKIWMNTDPLQDTSFNVMLWKDAMNGMFGGNGIIRSSDGGQNFSKETLPADWQPNNSLPPVSGIDWPGPSAYAYTAANNKIVIRNPAAGGTPVGPADGGTMPPDDGGSGGAAGADAAAGTGGASAGTGGAAAGTGGAGAPSKGGGGGCVVGGAAGSAGAIGVALMLALMLVRRRRL